MVYTGDFDGWFDDALADPGGVAVRRRGRRP